MLRLKNLNPYEQHKLIINEYILNRPGGTSLLKRDSSNDKTDIDVIRENHRFLWEEDDVADTWEKQFARKYYDKLFKEYTICDLSKFRENKVALRWRIEKEVVTGKGQFICGNKICNEVQGLRSWEVNFSYIEDGEKKNALVKQRLCPDCSEKLNYRSMKREIKRLKEAKKIKRRKSKSTRSRDQSGSDREDSSSDEDSEHQKEKYVEETCTSKDQGSSSRAECPREDSRRLEFQKFLTDLIL